MRCKMGRDILRKKRAWDLKKVTNVNQVEKDKKESDQHALASSDEEGKGEKNSLH